MQTIRRTVRLILINQNNHILMIKIVEPQKPGVRKRPYWITTGGAIEKNETEQEAIWRELLEETGIKKEDAQIISLIAKSDHSFEWEGKLCRFQESFYLVNTNALEIQSTNISEGEKDVFSEMRWWSVDEIKGSKEIFFPVNLVEILTACIELKAGSVRDKSRPLIEIDTSTPPHLFF